MSWSISVVEAVTAQDRFLPRLEDVTTVHFLVYIISVVVTVGLSRNRNGHVCMSCSQTPETGSGRVGGQQDILIELAGGWEERRG